MCMVAKSVVFRNTKLIGSNGGGSNSAVGHNNNHVPFLFHENDHKSNNFNLKKKLFTQCTIQ